MDHGIFESMGVDEIFDPSSMNIRLRQVCMIQALRRAREKLEKALWL